MLKCWCQTVLFFSHNDRVGDGYNFVCVESQARLLYILLLIASLTLQGLFITCNLAVWVCMNGGLWPDYIVVLLLCPSQPGDVDMLGLVVRLRLSWPGLERAGQTHTLRVSCILTQVCRPEDSNKHQPSATNLQHNMAWHLVEILRINNQMYGMMPFNKTIHLNGWN